MEEEFSILSIEKRVKEVIQAKEDAQTLEGSKSFSCYKNCNN
jgi:hypothetical protein